MTEHVVGDPAVAVTAARWGTATRTVLDDATLHVPRGAVGALVGANGAGKSTLLHLAAGLRRAAAGRVEVLGRPVDVRRPDPRVALLDQQRPLPDDFTVTEVLRLGRALDPDRWDTTYARELVDAARLGGRTRVRRLSGGERARLALVLALGSRPELLLLDEPLAGLDPLARDEVLRTVLTDVATRGTTVLLSSHDLADIGAVCDHVYLLRDGRFAVTGPVEDVVRTHRVLVGPASDLDRLGRLDGSQVVHARVAGRQATVLLHAPDPVEVPGWQDGPTDLAGIVHGHLVGEREPERGAEHGVEHGAEPTRG